MRDRRRDAEALDRLRREIEGIDRALVLLLAARLRAADRALRIRTGRGRAPTDREQEGRVLARGRRWALELGVPSRLVESLLRSIVEEGKARFLSGRPPADPDVVTVVLPEPRRSSVRFERRTTPELISVPPAG